MSECPVCGSTDIGYVDLWGGGRSYICLDCSWELVLSEEEV